MEVNFPEELISVVIPCYNSSTTIDDCLNSVLQQGYKNIEFVLVDDGSTDDTYEKLQKFREGHITNYHIIISQQKNSGPSVARNLGVTLAQGGLIALLDSDDVWIPGKLALQTKIYRSFTEAPALIGAQYSYNKTDVLNDGYRQITFKQMLFCNYFQTSSVLVPKQVLLNNKFNANQKYSEDYDVWLNIALQGKCLVINKPLTITSKRAFEGNGLSSKLWEMEKGELANFTRLLKKGHIKLFQFLFISTFSLLKFLRRALFTLYLNHR